MNLQPRISYSTPYTLWPLSWLLLVVGTGLYPDPYKYQKINPRMLNTFHWLQPHSGCSLLKLPQNGFWGITPSNLHGSGPNSAGTHPTRKYASRETLAGKNLSFFSVSNTTHRFSNFPEANWPQSWPQHVNRCPHESYRSRFSIFFPGQKVPKTTKFGILGTSLLPAYRPQVALSSQSYLMMLWPMGRRCAFCISAFPGTSGFAATDPRTWPNFAL